MSTNNEYEYEDIRPYADSEVSDILKRLLNDVDLLNFLARWRYPRMSRVTPALARLPISLYLRYKLGSVDSVRGFQDVVYHYVNRIIRETTDGFEYSGIESLVPDQSYLFVGNHRDIAGDSMLLDYALYVSGFDTVRIAVGDNLVQVASATDLMKLNKSFFIKRSEEGPKKVYAALLQSSRYIHQSLKDGHSIWIAQSEGRAKDGMDITDPAIIKMFALAERKTDFSELIQRLNIVPTSISYEYDPCDVQKAVELAEIARIGSYEKPKGEDLANLVRGLGGYKGRVKLKVGTPLKGEFSSADEVAQEVDRQVRENLELFPINQWAFSQLDSPTESDAGSEQFKQRLLACPDAARPHFLQMYANPVRNKAQI
ncbi:MAG: glycerol acyltransferase [Gammaproteobacteria bacterium]|nr:glycerol acyltransferase [Gammaproteobacteria bacterium]